MIKTRLARLSISLAAIGLSGAIGSAEAAPIATNSTINFAGSSTCNATGCTFGNAIVTSGTGSFSGFPFGLAATFFPVTFNPFTAEEIYVVTDAMAQTASFATTAPLAQSTQTFGGLTNYSYTDAGIAQLTGFDATPGDITFTANQNGSLQGSFSVTSDVAAPAPEPAVWVMMLLGFGAIGSAIRRNGQLMRRARLAWKQFCSHQARTLRIGFRPL